MNYGIFRCPTCARDEPHARANPRGQWGGACDYHDAIDPSVCGDAVPCWRAGTGGYGWNVCFTRRGAQHISEAEVEQPAERILIAEIFKMFNQAGLYPPPDTFVRLGITTTPGCGGGVGGGADGQWWQMSRRHNGGSNVAFFDGHVEWMRESFVCENPRLLQTIR